MHPYLTRSVPLGLLIAAACTGPLGDSRTVREGSINLSGQGLDLDAIDPEHEFGGSTALWTYTFDEEESAVRGAEIGGGVLAYSGATSFVEVQLDAEGATADTTWTSSSIRLVYRVGGYNADDSSGGFIAEGTDECTIEINGLSATFDCEGVPLVDDTIGGLPATIDLSGDLSSRQVIGSAGDE